MVPTLSAWGQHAPLPDAFPDPAGRHPLSPAVLSGWGQRVRGGGGVVIRHQVSVVRHEVPPESVGVLDGGGQEELHPTKDVQQRLQGGQTQTRVMPLPPGVQNRRSKLFAGRKELFDRPVFNLVFQLLTGSLE